MAGWLEKLRRSSVIGIITGRAARPDPSVEMRENLPLPPDLLGILDRTFMNLQSPLELGQITDFDGETMRHHRTPAQSGKIALLHVTPEIMSDASDDPVLINYLASIFYRNIDVLFIFSEVQALHRKYPRLAEMWEQQNKFKKAKFFDSLAINEIKDIKIDSKRDEEIIKSLWLNKFLTRPGVKILSEDDRELIRKILSDTASDSALDEKEYFRDFVRRMKMPGELKKEIADPWTGNAISDASHLVEWAEQKKEVAITAGGFSSEYWVLACLLDALYDDTQDARLLQIKQKL